MSARDLQCLQLAAQGKLAKDIASELGISQRAVEFHLLQARRDLNAKNTPHAIYQLIKRKIRKPQDCLPAERPAELFTSEEER